MTGNDFRQHATFFDNCNSLQHNYCESAVHWNHEVVSIKPLCHNYSFYNIIGLPSEKKDEKTGTLALGWHSKLYVHTCIHVHVYTCACTCSLYMHICTGNVLKLQIPTCMCAHVTNSPNVNNRQCFPTIESTLSTTVSLLFALASIGAVALGCA